MTHLEQQPADEPVAYCKTYPLRPDEWQRRSTVTWVNGPVEGQLYTRPQPADEIQRLRALVRAQQITIETLEQQREPVAWTATRLWNRRELWTCPADIERDLLDGYTQPAAQWVGLTDEDRVEILRLNGEAAVLYATEAKLREKNGEKA